MKTTYLKPNTEIVLLNTAPIMLQASGEGEKILDNGGNTSGVGITEGDSRRFSVWGDDEEE